MANNGGVSSVRELYPYSLKVRNAVSRQERVTADHEKLNSIDNMRVDGKFMVGSDIPEGQGSVNALLAECYEMAYNLRLQAQETQAAESDQSEEDGHPKENGSVEDGGYPDENERQEENELAKQPKLTKHPVADTQPKSVTPEANGTTETKGLTTA